MRTVFAGIIGIFSGSVLMAQQFASQPTPAPTASIIPAAATAHPWSITPQAGAWMICVKSFAGKNAKLSAEDLAREIRETYKVPAYLFERGAAERQQVNDKFHQDIEQKKREQEEQFNRIREQAKAEAKARGMDFLESKPRITAPKVNVEDQYAVLIGGWPDMASARREMDKVRMWPPPANKQLMDAQYMIHQRDGQASGEYVYINPYKSCMVAPNPLAPRPADTEGDADAKLLAKMNENEPLSLLRVQKPWTIVVKMFAPPPEIKTNEGKSLVARVFAPKQDVMGAAAEQASSLAKTLRDMQDQDKRNLNIDSYILHTRYGSMVCVGQYDSADDPKLMEMQQKLGMMTFNVGTNPQVIEKREKMFDRLYAMRVR